MPIQEGIFYLSSSFSGAVGGVSFTDEDILAYNPLTNQWWFVFDGSDVGLGYVDVDAMAFLPDGSLLLSLDVTFRLPDRRVVGKEDVLRFVPVRYGEWTVGTFEMYLDGSDVGLDLYGENINSLAVDPANGSLIIGTTTVFSAGGLYGAGSDLFRFTPTSLGENSAGTWSEYLRGEPLGFFSSTEALNATAFNPQFPGSLFLSTYGNFNIPGLEGTGKDIIQCAGVAPAPTNTCTGTTLFFINWMRFPGTLDALDFR